MASSTTSLVVRTWRTAFLTLRDETLTSPPTTTLVHQIIFCNLDTLILATRHLPPREVLSDTKFLMELAGTISIWEIGDADMVHIFAQLSHLIHNVCQVSFETNSSSLAVVLDCYRKLVEIFLGKGCTKKVFLRNANVIGTLERVLETLRYSSTVYQRTSSLSDNSLLLNFLLNIVSLFQAEVIDSPGTSVPEMYGFKYGTRSSVIYSAWEVQTNVFTMISEVYMRVGTCLPIGCWQSTVEVFRNVMDVLAAKSFLLEGNVFAKFYTSLLNCLHLIFVDAKGSLSDHVAGFVAALRMFFNYGLNHKSQTGIRVASQKENATARLSTNLTYSGPYRPPHLRQKDPKLLRIEPDPLFFPDHEFSLVDHVLPDSNLSDNEGSKKETFSITSSKARVAALVCLQDLCRAEPKSFILQWMMLLPSSDVLQLRKFDATLMSCLLFDPYLKARITCASTLASMLDGPASVFLQMAEYKESTRCGSFMAFSSSLGQILLQLHTGVLYLIKLEKNSELVPSLFNILKLLISSTPYSRMPAELLQTVILSLQGRIEEGFLPGSDQIGLLTVAISCLTAAISVSPSSSKVNELFSAEMSRGVFEGQSMSGVLSTLFHHSESVTNPIVSFEALQALRAVAHNYPNIMAVCWDHVSSVIFRLLKLTSPQVSIWSKQNGVGHPVSAIEEKVITAAVKVLDECLRAISGFKGTEDLWNDKVVDCPFTSDCVKIKTISSAPSYASESSSIIIEEPEMHGSSSKLWCRTIDCHMSLILQHTSAMVRTASVTCFAGITSSVFSSLPNEKQEFVLTSCINAAQNDEVPSVRSAACRAIGVIVCFTQVSQSAETVEKFIYAAEINTCSPLVSVRTAASWALANICDALCHCLTAVSYTSGAIDSKGSCQFIPLLIDCAMRLTTDGDKIKANAVRALGNLSRFVDFSNQSNAHYGPIETSRLSLLANTCNKHLLPHYFEQPSLGNSYWIKRMIHAFLYCVTSGNVKVQWNICHALSNLFLNETLKLRDMDWAPSAFGILLLLLRDSSNFKIKMHAAAALAVPASITDYGKSFLEVVQTVEQILENMNVDHVSTPSSFRYRVSLEKQLTSTLLHLLGLASSTDHQPLHGFLVERSSFLEDWLKVLCSSLEEASSTPETGHGSARNQKKQVIGKAIRSLIEVFEGQGHHNIAQRFDKLESSIL